MTRKSRIQVLALATITLGAITMQTGPAIAQTVGGAPRMCDITCPPAEGYVLCGGSCSDSSGKMTCEYQKGKCTAE